MPKKPAPKEMHSWRIHRIRSTPPAYIGVVEAPHEEAAIQAAIEKFKVTNADEQKRLVAQCRD